MCRGSLRWFRCADGRACFESLQIGVGFASVGSRLVVHVVDSRRGKSWGLKDPEQARAERPFSFARMAIWAVIVVWQPRPIARWRQMQRGSVNCCYHRQNWVR